ncbi:MAG: phosphotransferase [Steroidobacteraceae bacterium]|jgi:thiamine kinase-like enzyme|nr:phosphotransferase [Steroidobacteraceae bacterium]
MSASPVPPAVRAALEGFAAGREALGTALRVRPLPAGLRNRAFRVNCAALDWVVRLGGADDAALGVDRDSEALAFAVAAAHGLAPRLVHCAPGSGVLVTEFVAAPTWTLRRARSADGIRGIGARLARLHALAAPAGVKRFAAVAVLATLRAAPPPPTAVVPRDRLERHADAALRELGAFDGSGGALCHLDLHHRNVLDRGEPLFVDWEYAACADPALDLAAYACYHDFDAPRRRALLEAHGGGVPAERLAYACRLFDALQAWWYEATDGWAALRPPRRERLLARLEP